MVCRRRSAGRRESDEDERRARQRRRARAATPSRRRRRAPALSRFRRSRHCPRRTACTIPRSPRIPAASASSPTSRAASRTRSSRTRCTILVNLEHRGAVGADPRAGDGAGILVQIPHKFFARKAKELGITLPKPGEYGIGVLFMPRDAERRELVRKTFEQVAAQEGLSILGWRTDMPIDNSTLGESVKPTEPFHMQVFIGQGKKEAQPRTSSSAGSTSCASRSRPRSIASTSGGCPAITRCRSPAAP